MTFNAEMIFDGRYEIVSVCDYSQPVEQAVARDRQTGELVMLNLFSKADIPGEKSLAHLEIELTKRLGVSHPNIVRLLRINRWSDELGNVTLYFVTEYFEGESLAKRIERLPKDPLSFAQVLKVLHQIASAVTALHKAELLATNLYPKTILFGPEDTVKLPAFAFVSSSQWLRDQSAVFRKTGANYRYVAPEMISQAGVMVGHHKSDVYLFGILAYELVTGVVPFDGVTETLIEMQRHEPVPSLQSETGIPEWYDALIRECMNKSPLQRPFIETIEVLLEERREEDNQQLLAYPDRSYAHILFVEDNRLDQLFISRLIKEQQCPFTCLFASSVGRAKKMIAEHQFDLIVSDYVLPDGTALDLLKSGHSTPTIVVTGSDAYQVNEAVLKAGAYDCIFKEPAQRHLRGIPKLITRLIELIRLKQEVAEYREAVTKTLTALKDVAGGELSPGAQAAIEEVTRFLSEKIQRDTENGDSHVLSTK